MDTGRQFLVCQRTDIENWKHYVSTLMCMLQPPNGQLGRRRWRKRLHFKSVHRCSCCHAPWIGVQKVVNIREVGWAKKKSISRMFPCVVFSQRHGNFNMNTFNVGDTMDYPHLFHALLPSTGSFSMQGTTQSKIGDGGAESESNQDTGSIPASIPDSYQLLAGQYEVQQTVVYSLEPEEPKPEVRGQPEIRRFHDFYEFSTEVRGNDQGYVQEYLRCYGCGGCGAVFEVVEKSTGLVRVVKITETCDSVKAHELFEGEIKTMEALRSLLLLDEPAQQVIIASFDGFWDVIQAADGSENPTAVIYTIMEASPQATPFPVPTQIIDSVALGGYPLPRFRKLLEWLGGVRGSGCDLLNFVGMQAHPLSTTQAAFVMRQVFQALSFLHRNGIIHRDVKPDNFLIFDYVDFEGENCPLIKLTDFGYAYVRGAAESEDGFRSGTGTPAYMSPEIKTAHYSTAVDIFAAGCTMFALMTKLMPSTIVEYGFPERFLGRKSAQNLRAVVARVFPRYGEESSPQLDLLAWCTQARACDRPTADELLCHPFILSGEM
jgi:serine/threonine protein kinase